VASKTGLVPEHGKKQSGKMPIVFLGKHC